MVPRHAARSFSANASLPSAAGLSSEVMTLVIPAPPRFILAAPRWLSRIPPRGGPTPPSGPTAPLAPASAVAGASPSPLPVQRGVSDKLSTYRSMRDPAVTPEPMPAAPPPRDTEAAPPRDREAAPPRG